jgi:hypothetical protein
MDQDQPVFKPRYPLVYRLVVLILPIGFFVLLLRGIVAPRTLPITYWYITLLCGMLTAIFPFLIIREIRFADDMIVCRYFLPDVFINYIEAYTIEPTVIRVRQRHIRLGRVQNLEELNDMSKRWSARKALKDSRRNQILTKMVLPSRGVGAYASFWGLVLGLIVAILQPSQLSFDPRWLPGSTFAIIYFLFVYVIPKL